jgi:hypothetical protein
MKNASWLAQVLRNAAKRHDDLQPLARSSHGSLRSTSVQ